jgi:hypothetical protein
VAQDRFIGGHDTNQVGFWNNNAWRLTVLNNGNVGIGTITPGATLDVVGGGGGSVDLQVNGRLRSNSNDGGLWVAQDRFVGGVNNLIGFWSGDWRLLVTPTGQVGIGSSAPVADLEIGTFATNQDSFVALKATGGNVHRVGMKLWTWQENFGYSLQFDERGVGPDGFHVKFHNVDPNGVSRLYIDMNGNVGIGTTSVGTKLSVAGNAYIQSDLWVNGKFFMWWGPNNVWFQLENAWNGPSLTGGHGGPPSDLRLKTDLRPIGQALDAVRQLTGQRYRWGEDGLAHFTKNIESSVVAGPDATQAQNREAWQAERRRRTQELAGDRIGLIAQDVEIVLPELIHTDEDGYKHISYQHLTAVLVEAIKEQDAAVRALTSEVAALRQGQQG